MTIKVYVNDDQTATFTCPQCRKPRITNVSKYIARNEHTRLKVKCGCGHQYEAFLEKRKKYRKQTSLTGIYKYNGAAADNPSTKISGRLTVTDVSFTGLRVKFPFAPRFTVGDKLFVEFTLNDKNQTLVQKEVVVKNMMGLHAGLEYIFTKSYDACLGFFLLSKS